MNNQDNTNIQNVQPVPNQETPQQVVQQPQIQPEPSTIPTTQQPVQTVEQPTVQVTMPQDNGADINQQMQSIPNVEQNVQNFVQNTQAANTVSDDSEKKGSLNIVFIIILFAIIFAAMFFLFPLLLNKLG